MHKNKLFIYQLLPSLSYNQYKGQNGKFGNIGGSREYIGAPHYVSMAQLKCVSSKGSRLVFHFLLQRSLGSVEGSFFREHRNSHLSLGEG